jgi:hypothetical protein
VRKWIVLAVVAAVVLVAAPLALASHGHGQKPGHGRAHGKSKFQLVGKITAIDADAGTLTVHVKSGTKTIRPYRHTDLVLTLTDTAVVRLVTDDEASVVTLAELSVGAKVKVGGLIDRSGDAPVFFAKRVLAHQAPAAAPTPEPTPEPTPSDQPTPEPSTTPDPATTPAG